MDSPTGFPPTSDTQITLNLVLCTLLYFPNLNFSPECGGDWMSEQRTKYKELSKLRTEWQKTKDLFLSEPHRHSIHAISQAGRLRAIVKDVTEMRVATSTKNLSPRFP